MRFPKILVLILNWNGKQDTLACLTSLASALPSPAFATLVVDNGSTDDSVAAIRAAHPAVPILETHSNLGFAGGNNAGIRWALTKSFEWIFLLNNDTVVAPDLIQRLMQATKEKPSGKIFGAKSFRAHDRNRIDHLGSNWDPGIAEFVSPAAGALDDGSFETMTEVDMVSGCALLMHRSVPERIGLLEESFFLLWEETDFCARARRAGFEIWTAPQAKLWHKVSASFTGGKPHLHYFWWRNRLLWISRNCTSTAKRHLYRTVILPEMIKCIKLAFLKTLQLALLTCLRLPLDSKKIEKARRYRAGCKGIFHYYWGRFGNL